MSTVEPVRPTKNCLDAIGVLAPNLGVRLSDIEHPLVMRAQQVPQQVASKSAERIRSLTDRVWLKVKTSTWRGAVGDLENEISAEIQQFAQHWWLCAGGVRREDSPQSDFYSQLDDHAHAEGANSCSTDFMLPGVWDNRRLVAEAAVNAQKALSGLVVAAAAQSLMHSDIRGFTIGDRDVRVRIKVHEDGQAYIALSATGSIDHSFFVTLMSAIPGLATDDWMAEPDGSLEIEPEPGEIIWSTMLPAGVQSMLAEQATLD
jgi:hypothetical protein